ncbi:hypothetical protein D3C78_1608370 [compost metagenome]
MALLREEAGAADEELLAVDRGRGAMADDRFEIPADGGRSALGIRVSQDGCGEGVLGARLDGGGELDDRGGLPIAPGQDRANLGASIGEGAGLVEGDGLNRGGGFEMRAALDEDAAPGRVADARD